MAKRIRLAVIGVGNVGSSFLGLLQQRADRLAHEYGLAFTLTGVADSSGALLDESGISVGALRSHKATGRGVGLFPGGRCGMPAAEMITEVKADLLVEASVVNLATGQPGLECTRIALNRGMAVALANKGPLVHAFAELTALASERHAGLAYSATVCGALPVINIGRRDLVAAEIHSVRGIFNSTTNFILGAMTRGRSFADALSEAQEAGVAEADPSLDLQGWDTANKLVIITNSVLNQPAKLSDVAPVSGIVGIGVDQIRQAASQGKVVKLVAEATRLAGGYRLRVRPEWLPAGDFLAGVTDWEMGIVFDTDIMGLQQFKVDERGPVPTAAALLRDVVNLSIQRSPGPRGLYECHFPCN